MQHFVQCWRVDVTSAAARRTEDAFWMVSCLPYGRAGGIYARVNVGFQTLFEAGVSRRRGTPYARGWIGRETAERGLGCDLSELDDLGRAST